MHANRLIVATRVIRYIILAAIVAGAIRSGFFVSESAGPNLLVALVFIWPFLIVAFCVFVVPWETKVKSPLTPFIVMLVICVLLALPSLIQSLQILWQ